MTFKDSSAIPEIDIAKHLLSSYSQDSEPLSLGSEFGENVP